MTHRPAYSGVEPGDGADRRDFEAAGERLGVPLLDAGEAAELALVAVEVAVVVANRLTRPPSIVLNTLEHVTSDRQGRGAFVFPILRLEALPLRP